VPAAGCSCSNAYRDAHRVGVLERPGDDGLGGCGGLPFAGDGIGLGDQGVDRPLRRDASLQSQATSDALEVYEAVELINALQNRSDIDRDTMIVIEIGYLMWLHDGRDTFAKTVERRMADEPYFFVETMRLVFKSRNDDGEKKPGISADRASNLYQLLFHWRIAPGTLADGGFDGQRLVSWFDEVRRLVAESGHIEVAQQIVGQVFTCAPADPSGLWIRREIAALLDRANAKHLRIGFTMSLFSDRGVHFIDPSGAAEITLAEQYEGKAENVNAEGFLRIGGALRDLASSYRREADQVRADAEDDN
jgi:hypothetical protein